MDDISLSKQSNQEKASLFQRYSDQHLQKNGVLEAPLTGPREVSPSGDETGAGSSFYGDDEWQSRRVIKL